jgi:hypothetical protein
MLFDLKGKRRRVVQAVYILLAVLMGGGLVLFGIGGGTSGGLLNAFNGGGGSSNGNKALQQQIDAAQKKLLVNPQNGAALTQIIRGNYQLAGLNVDTNTGVYTGDGKKFLQKAADAWQQYLNTNPAKPDATLANFMFQAYSQAGLNQPAKAEKAAEIVAGGQNSAAAYITVVQYASLAGDTRTANLAATKALELASKGQRSSVKKLIQQAKAAGAASQQTQNGTTGGGG